MMVGRPVMHTCGWCRFYESHPETMPRFAFGMWMGDGKCKRDPLDESRHAQGRITVVGDSCDQWEDE